MQKYRMVSTRFWSDNFISELNPLDRYLFLYFLTNEHTNICGTYEVPLKMMSFETGIEIEMLVKMIKRLSGKIYYIDGWVFIKNFEKYQTPGENTKIGIKRCREEVPKNIIKKINEILKETLPSNSDSLPTLSEELPTLSDNLTKPNLTKDNIIGDDVSSEQKEQKPLGHKEVMEYFHQCVTRECGSPPTINGGKDGLAVKKALSKYPIGDVKRIIDFYLNSDKVEKFGYNLSVALSADTMNKWLYEEKRLR